MNPLAQAAITSAVRWALAIGAGYFVHKGIWTSGDATTYVEAASMAVVSFAWSQRNVIVQRAHFLMALMMHNATENEVKLAIKAGEPTPALTTPPDTVPGVPKP